MSTQERDWHLRMSRETGKELACDNKVNYLREETATRIAEKLNGRGDRRRELEAYPCWWCQGWHIGGKMARESHDDQG
jgi:hypothetical protein